MRGFGTTIVIGILLLAAFAFIAIIYYSRPKKNTLDEATLKDKKIIKTHKIFTLASKVLEAES